MSACDMISNVVEKFASKRDRNSYVDVNSCT